MAATIARPRLSVTDYHRLLETGALTEDDRVELIDGEVRVMSPIGAMHAALVNRLAALLMRAAGAEAIVSVQTPVQLSDDTEPQPDLALLAPRSDFYSGALPRPGDVLLLIEVADTSLEYDRGEKLARYAAAGIAEVWIVDAAARRVEQHGGLRAGGYRTQCIHGPGSTIAPAALPHVALRVEEIFPGPPDE